MGIFKQHVTKQEVTAKQVSEMLTEKLGDGYKVEFKAKGNLGKQMLGAGKEDSVLVIKNAYHRTRITVTDKNAEGDTFFAFGDSEISPVLKFIGKETGFIGGLIIGLIYGKADDFYDGIYEHIKKEYNTEIREHEYGLKAGLNAVLGKNKK